MDARNRSWRLAPLVVIALVVPGGCALLFSASPVGVQVASSPIVEARPSDHAALNDDVHAIVLIGPDLHVAGAFTDAAGIPEADRIVRWDGNAWSALGSDPGWAAGPSPAPMWGSTPTPEPVPTVAAASSSPAAHPAGTTDGALEWTVYDLAVIGPDLYVAGGFHDAAGIPEADFIARWDGSDWSAVGSGGSGDGALNSTVYALAVSGTDLYVGGTFTVAGVPGADQVARWDGSTWSAVAADASGDRTFGGYVLAVAVSGTDLYAGGAVSFLDATGAVRTDGVARWDGSAWSTLGERTSGAGALSNLVPATSTDDENFVFALAASGKDVYAGGRFADAADIPEADHIAWWDGSDWSALGSDGAGDGAIAGTVHALALSGNDLYVAGDFTDAAGIPEADHIARWDGSTWSALGSDGAGDGAIDGPVTALAVFGTDLFVGGDFTSAGGITGADRLVRWDGTHWSTVGD